MALKRFQLRIMMNRRIRREDALIVFPFPGSWISNLFINICRILSIMKWIDQTIPEIQKSNLFMPRIIQMDSRETRHTWDVPATVNLHSSHHLTSGVNEWTISKANLCPLPVACKLNKLHRTTVARKPYGQRLCHQHHYKQETLLINKRVLSSLN